MSLSQLFIELSEPCSEPPEKSCRVLMIGWSGYVKPLDIHIETGWYDAERKHWYNDGYDRISEGWPEPLFWIEYPRDEDRLEALLETVNETP